VIPGGRQLRPRLQCGVRLRDRRHLRPRTESLSPVENAPAFENYFGATDYPEPDTLQLILAAESVTGLCLTSFHGCYDGSQSAVPASD